MLLKLGKFVQQLCYYCLLRLRYPHVLAASNYL